VAGKARLLLKADVSEAGEGWSDSRIAAALDTSIATIERTRRQLVEADSRHPSDPTPAHSVICSLASGKTGRIVARCTGTEATARPYVRDETN
jgi:hypothetical protein